LFFIGLYKPSYGRLIETTKKNTKWGVKQLPETLEEAYALASQHCPENVNSRSKPQQHNQARQAKLDAPAALPATEEQPQETETAALRGSNLHHLLPLTVP